MQINSFEKYKLNVGLKNGQRSPPMLNKHFFDYSPNPLKSVYILFPSINIRDAGGSVSSCITPVKSVFLFTPLMKSIMEPPYPPSKITAVEFEDKSKIIRKAKGSDNWPITWADDDFLYTAFGDGWGFEPRTQIKLSLGLAKISGLPDNFMGEKQEGKNSNTNVKRNL